MPCSYLTSASLRIVGGVNEEGPDREKQDPSPEAGASAHGEENLADETSLMDPGTLAMCFRQRFIIHALTDTPIRMAAFYDEPAANASADGDHLFGVMLMPMMPMMMRVMLC